MVFEGVVVVMMMLLFGYAQHLRNLLRRHDHEFQRTKTALQSESNERGKLSRRLARAETKVAKLAKSK